MRPIRIFVGLVVMLIGVSGCGTSLMTPVASRPSGDGEIFASSSNSRHSLDKPISGNAFAESVDLGLDYSGWKLLKDDTYSDAVEAPSACQAPSNVIGSPVPTPHRNYALKVFVSHEADGALGTRDAQPLPVGSAIVKEKWRHDKDRVLEGIGVMIKREAGYDPEHGDWEYVFETKGHPNSVVRGRLDNCRSCHSKASSLDYVFLSSRDDLLNADADRRNASDF